MSFTPLKAVALVVFLGAVAGATYGVQTIVGDSIGGTLVAAEPVHNKVNATGGHDVSFALTLRNLGDAEREMRAVVSGDAAQGQSGLVKVPADGAVTVFVPVTVSSDAAPGEHRLAARLEDADGAPLRERAASLRLVVLPQGEGLQEGQAANVVYTLRLAEGAEPVVATTDGALARAPILRARSVLDATAATPARLDGAFPLSGVYEDALGMQPGESRRIVVDAADAFPATDDARFEAPREDAIELVTEIPTQERTQPRAEFDAVLRQNGQDPTAIQVGEGFTRRDERTGNDVRYVVTNLTQTAARFRFQPEVGDRYTLFMAWQNASVVESANETVVTFRTEPSAVGETFTWYEQWPGVSTVASVNETHAVVRHTPALGTAHEEPDPFGRAAPTRYVVREVNDDAIVIAYSNHPLAGMALVADVRLVEILQG